MVDEQNDGAWFDTKRLGFGASLPISWQGWALTFGYVGLLLGVRHLAASSNPAGHAVAVLLLVLGTGAFVAISWRRTRGGWKWRWGSRD